MLIDGATLSGKDWNTDLCIVGGGAAGITMAHQLHRSGMTVSVIESGLDFDGPQQLYRGNPGDLMGRVDADFLCRSRKRFYGGTTNCWGGWSRPLDRVDFHARSGVDFSGWPISRADLEPFYAEAQAVCNLGAARYDDIPFWEQQTGLEALTLRGHTLQNAMWQSIAGSDWEKQWWRFGQFYCKELRDSENVTVIQNANVLLVKGDAAGRRVEHLDVAPIVGGAKRPTFRVVARTFVLAMGGIETVRLLQLSNQGRTPFGNAQVLGRYFMVHPLITNAGAVTFQQPLSERIRRFYAESTQVPIGAAAGHRSTAAAASPLPLEDPHERPGAPAAVAGADACTIRVEPFPCQDEQRATHVNVWCTLKPTEPAMGARLGNFRIILRGGPSVFSIDVNWEQVPNPASRLTLSTSTGDPIFQQPVVDLNWRLTEQDKETVRTALVLLDREMALLGGTTRIDVDLSGGADQWPTRSTHPNHYLQPGDHHMGTARMAADERYAYTDANCKVLGVDNLYVTGSAVFATGGVANPTLTIIALAARLAAHLRR